MTASLVVALASYPGYVRYAVWLVAAMTALLVYSFADSTFRVYGERAIGAK